MKWSNRTAQGFSPGVRRQGTRLKGRPMRAAFSKRQRLSLPWRQSDQQSPETEIFEGNQTRCHERSAAIRPPCYQSRSYT